jgi:hypothetical protein
MIFEEALKLLNEGYHIRLYNHDFWLITDGSGYILDNDVRIGTLRLGDKKESFSYFGEIRNDRWEIAHYTFNKAFEALLDGKHIMLNGVKYVLDKGEHYGIHRVIDEDTIAEEVCESFKAEDILSDEWQIFEPNVKNYIDKIQEWLVL